MNNLVSGQIRIKGIQPYFYGNEILYISIRDSLQHDKDCIELGSKIIYLNRGELFPIYYQCFYNPYKAHMKFKELLTIPGGVTISAQIERYEQLLYSTNTDIPLGRYVDIQLVKLE